MEDWDFSMENFPFKVIREPSASTRSSVHYSARRFFTGLLREARMVWKLIVTRAMATASKPASIKISGPTEDTVCLGVEGVVVGLILYLKEDEDNNYLDSLLYLAL